MPTHYKLVSSGRPDVQADEIVVGRDEDGTEHSISMHEARPLLDKWVADAKNLAHKMGFRVMEVEVPEDDKTPEGGESQEGDVEQRQEAGLDTQAQATANTPADAAQSSTAPQQGSQDVQSETPSAFSH